MKHGEYKTPGGKLVIVDFSTEGAAIVDMQINGDFFLEPAEALDALNQALNGANVEASEQELASLVADAIPAGAELVGFSPEAVAIAVRRALS